MANNKSLLTGSTTMLVLKLLDGQDMYGYQMIEELARRSDHTFELKAGTLYPLLHALEEKELISAYEKAGESLRPRRYYQLSRKGKKLLDEKQAEWTEYSGAVDRVLRGGASIANA
ncbi:MAG: PadR family transcriptional regulator [Clostridiales bacterium]|nr:PadR family transcriptional regulator [Clostridiales bacterium]